MKKTEIFIIVIIFIFIIVFLTTLLSIALRKSQNRIKKTDFSKKSYSQIKKLLGEEQEKFITDGKTVRIWKTEDRELELVFDEADEFAFICRERLR